MTRRPSAASDPGVRARNTRLQRLVEARDRAYAFAMRARELRAAALALLVASVGCGGRAAGGAGTACASEEECAGGLACVAGICGDGSPEPGAPSASEPPRGECALPGCAILAPPGAGGAGPAPGAGGAAGASGGAAGASGASSSPDGDGSSSAPGGNGGSGGSPAAPAPERLSSVLPGATAVVSEPVGPRFFVALGASAPQYADHVVAFDVDAGAIVADAFVGGNPDALALSDDGTTLWVGLRERSSVLRVDVSQALLPVAEYPLPPGDGVSAPAAGSLVLLPGSRSSLAISLHGRDRPTFAGVVLLDEGEPRPLRLPGGTGAARLTRGPDGYLWGHDDAPGSLYAIGVSADGLSQTEHPNLVSGVGATVVYDTNTLFGSDGSVIRVTNPDYPLLVGQLPATGLVVPDVAAGVAWVLEGARAGGEPARLSLVLVTLPTRERLGASVFDPPVASPRHFVRSRRRAFAFVADTPAGGGAPPESALYWMLP